MRKKEELSFWYASHCLTFQALQGYYTDTISVSFDMKREEEPEADISLCTVRDNYKNSEYGTKCYISQRDSLMQAVAEWRKKYNPPVGAIIHEYLKIYHRYGNCIVSTYFSKQFDTKDIFFDIRSSGDGTYPTPKSIESTEFDITDYPSCLDFAKTFWSQYDFTPIKPSVPASPKPPAKQSQGGKKNGKKQA